MKVLVTGATGFIGQYVVKELLKRPNIEIVATTRSLEKARNLDFYHQVKFVEADLSKVDNQLFKKLGSPDHMVHLAWDGLPHYKELFHIEKNFHENYFFIKQMIESGLQDLTVTGTCFEYGMVEGALDENMATNPNNAYGISKDTLRKCIVIFQQKSVFSFKWLRLFYMYGKGQSANSLTSQIEKAILNEESSFNMSGGEQVRDFLPVELVAHYIVECALQKEVTGVINCCSGKPITVKDFVINYLHEKNYTLKLNLGFYPYPDYEPMKFWGDNTKLNKVIFNGKV